MSEELKATANNGTEAQKPAAPAAAAKPAAARPAVARPAAAPAKPAVNELKPKTVAAADLHAEMKRLHDEEGMDFLLNLTGEDWLEDGIGVVYQVENTENHKQACVKCVVSDRENPMIPSVSDLGTLPMCMNARCTTTTASSLPTILICAVCSCARIG